MLTQNLLYDMMIVIYALSLLFYFSDFVDANRRAKRIGAGLLLFVWLLQTGCLLMRLVKLEGLHLLTTFETILFFTWLLTTISLTASRFYRIELFVFLVNVVGFVVLTLNLLNDSAGAVPLEPWQLVQHLLVVHIALVLCAYAAYTIAAVLSGMYLFLHGQLKRKAWTSAMRRLPSLETIDRFTYRAVLVGTPLLILSLGIAVASLLIENRTGLLTDWKVLASLIAAVFYIGYLVKRAALGQSGRQTALWNLAAFAVLVLNVLLSSASRFHSWS